MVVLVKWTMFDIKFFILNIFISLLFHSPKISCSSISYNEIYNDYDSTLQAEKTIPENIYNSAEVETSTLYLNLENNNQDKSNNQNINDGDNNDDNSSELNQMKFNKGDLYPDYSILNGRNQVQFNTDIEKQQEKQLEQQQQEEKQQQQSTTTWISDENNNNKSKKNNENVQEQEQKEESTHNEDFLDRNDENEKEIFNKFSSYESWKADEQKLPDENFLIKHRGQVQSNFDKHKIHQKKENNLNGNNAHKHKKTLKFKDFESYQKHNQQSNNNNNNNEEKDVSILTHNNIQRYNQHQSQYEHKYKPSQLTTSDEHFTIISYPKSVKNHNNKYHNINHQQHHHHLYHQQQDEEEENKQKQHETTYHTHHLNNRYHQHNNIQYHHSHQHHQQQNPHHHHHHHHHHQHHQHNNNNFNKMKHHIKKWPNLSRSQSQYQLPSEQNDYTIDDLPPYIKKYNRRTKQLQDLLEGTIAPSPPPPPPPLPPQSLSSSFQLQEQQKHQQPSVARLASSSLLYSLHRTTIKPSLSLLSMKKIKNERIHRNHNKNPKWTIEDLFEEQRANPNTPNTNSDNDDDQYMMDSTSLQNSNFNNSHNNNNNNGSITNGQNQTIITTTAATTTTESNVTIKNYIVQHKEMLKTNELPFEDDGGGGGGGDDDNIDFSQENSIEYDIEKRNFQIQRDNKYLNNFKNSANIDDINNNINNNNNNNNNNSKSKSLIISNNRIPSSTNQNNNNNNNNDSKFSNNSNNNDNYNNNNENSTILLNQDINNNNDNNNNNNNNNWSSRTNSFIYHRVEAPRMVGIGDIGKKQRLPFVAITDRKLELSKMQQKNRQSNIYEKNHFPMP